MSWMVKEEKCAGCGWPAVARVRATKDDPFEPVCEECRLVIVRRIQHAAHKFGRGRSQLDDNIAMAIEMIESQDIRPFILLPPSKERR